MNYYNEWDKGAAAWLRELIKQGHIPLGVVDERSITEVKPEDLDGFTQCHFFAGIGGWSLALRLAGVPETTPLWTGSPPCQPFSSAGAQRGKFDPRHLAPTFLNLIGECRPAMLFGEQVAPAIAKSWMCDLQAHLEGEHYAVGFSVLPACSVGAPHKRERLFFGASRLVNSYSNFNRGAESGSYGAQESAAPGYGKNIIVPGEFSGDGSDVHNFWAEFDTIECSDGKGRAVEPGTFPLANGISARMGRLRGYGNAIVPEVASEFIKAFNWSIK